MRVPLQLVSLPDISIFTPEIGFIVASIFIQIWSGNLETLHSARTRVMGSLASVNKDFKIVSDIVNSPAGAIDTLNQNQNLIIDILAGALTISIFGLELILLVTEIVPSAAVVLLLGAGLLPLATVVLTNYLKNRIITSIKKDNVGRIPWRTLFLYDQLKWIPQYYLLGAFAIAAVPTAKFVESSAFSVVLAGSGTITSYLVYFGIAGFIFFSYYLRRVHVRDLAFIEDEVFCHLAPDISGQFEFTLHIGGSTEVILGTPKRVGRYLLVEREDGFKNRLEWKQVAHVACRELPVPLQRGHSVVSDDGAQNTAEEPTKNDSEGTAKQSERRSEGSTSVQARPKPVTSHANTH
jgi:hypothetical protein